MGETQERTQPEAPRTWRYWASRIPLAVLSPLIFLALLEGATVLFLGPIFYPLPGLDEAARYLQFTLPERFNPLFEQRGSGESAEFATVPVLYEGEWFFAREQSFPAQRGPEDLRIAFLGGSSVQGWPFREEGVVFTDLVETELRERFGSRRIDVINAGVGTYSSFQLVDVADQLSLMRPDVAVVYAGHNDQGYYYFDRGYLDLRASQGGLRRSLNRFHFFQAARMGYDRYRKWRRPHDDEWKRNHDLTEAAFIPEESVGEVEPSKYIEYVRMQQEWLPAIVETNLKDVVSRLQEAGAEVLIVPPVANLRDFRPTFAMHWAPLTADALRTFGTAVASADRLMLERGVGDRRMRDLKDIGPTVAADTPLLPVPRNAERELLATGSPEAVAACEEPLQHLGAAAAVSPDHALVKYLQGVCLLHSDPAAARAAFEAARDHSPARAPGQRAPTAIREAVRTVARETGATLVSVDEAVAATSPVGIPGGEAFVDNLHFSVEGHRAVARALNDALASLDVVTRGPSSGREADPPPEETIAALKERAQVFTWGMGLQVDGAGQPMKGPGGPAK